MVFSYSEFHNRSDENVEDFLEQMEVGCISNQIQNPTQRLHLLQLFLKGHVWVRSRTIEEGSIRENPLVQLNSDNLKEGLEAKFVKTLHEVQDL